MMKMWEREKASDLRQPHGRSNRIGIKMDSGIRNGVKYLKGHPGFGPSLSPPPVIPLSFGDVTLKCSVPSVG